MLVFVLLLYRDMKKDIYALIHVKPLSAMEFLIGKLVAGISVVFGATDRQKYQKTQIEYTAFGKLICSKYRRKSGK